MSKTYENGNAERLTEDDYFDLRLMIEEEYSLGEIMACAEEDFRPHVKAAYNNIIKKKENPPASSE